MSNYKSVEVESQTGVLSLAYERLPGSEGIGFKATFHVGSYCPPWERRCGGTAGGCFTPEQHCDGKWDCPETGKDEEGCRGCSPNQFACGVAGQRAVVSSRFANRPVCYPVSERCNYQLYCADGSDEKDCTVCQPGTFHCDSDRSGCTFYTVILRPDMLMLLIFHIIIHGLSNIIEVEILIMTVVSLVLKLCFRICCFCDPLLHLCTHRWGRLQQKREIKG